MPSRKFFLSSTMIITERKQICGEKAFKGLLIFKCWKYLNISGLEYLSSTWITD
jgi:hypothetical protein